MKMLSLISNKTVNSLGKPRTTDDKSVNMYANKFSIDNHSLKQAFAQYLLCLVPRVVKN